MKRILLNPYVLLGAGPAAVLVAVVVSMSALITTGPKAPPAPSQTAKAAAPSPPPSPEADRSAIIERCDRYLSTCRTNEGNGWHIEDILMATGSGA